MRGDRTVSEPGVEFYKPNKATRLLKPCQPQMQVPELQQLLGMLGGLPAAQGHQLLPALGSTATAVAALQQEQRQHLEHQQQQFVQQQEEQQRQRQLEEAVDLLHSMLRQRAAAGAHPTSHTLGNNSARSPPLAEGAAGGSGASRSGPQHSEPEAGGVVRPKALSLPLLSNLNAGEPGSRRPASGWQLRRVGGLG